MDKEYWKLKKREQRMKKRAAMGLGKSEPESDNATKETRAVTRERPVESSIIPQTDIHTSDITKCPGGVPVREWAYACERAARSKRYAEMFPSFLKPSEKRFQDPMWQWENEVRGRFGGIVGGNFGEQTAKQT